MGSRIAKLADYLHAAEEVIVHHVPEFVCAHEADQLVVPGQHKLAVHGIHPFDGKLHRPPAVEHAGRGIDLKDSLRRYRHLRKGGKLGLGEEYVKVGHCGINSSFAKSCNTSAK